MSKQSEKAAKAEKADQAADVAAEQEAEDAFQEGRAATGRVRMRAAPGLGASGVGEAVYVAGEDGTAQVAAEHVSELEGHGWVRVE